MDPLILRVDELREHFLERTSTVSFMLAVDIKFLAVELTIDPETSGATNNHQSLLVIAR